MPPDEAAKLNPDLELDKDVAKKEKYFERYEIANVDIGIFLNRLTGIFEALMTNLEFAATLPAILSNPEVLEILATGDLRQIITAFAFYFEDDDSEKTGYSQEGGDYEEFAPSYEEVSTSDKNCDYSPSKSYESSGFGEQQMNIFNALKSLYSYEPIRQLSKVHRNEISRTTINFLRQIKLFMEHVIAKTTLSPEEDRENELHIRYLCSEIERTKQEISELNVSLEEQKERQRTELSVLFIQVEAASEAWQKINDDFNDELAQTLKDSEDNQAKSLEEFNVRMENLKTALENLKKKLAAEKMESRKIEAAIQGRKFKAESQLTSLIMKYDTEIGDRQEFYEELMAEFNGFDKEKEQLMDEMDAQMEIYEAIVAEREEKEFEAYREKYEKFVRKRCAKIIQRWWRKILKSRKKKKKKGKKKKK